MRFGINLLSQHSAHRTQGETYHEMLEQAVAAEVAGFDGVFLNEHHLFKSPAEYWLPPIPALVGLAIRTSRVMLGTSALILPLHQPIRLAEDAAFIQAISGGRLILGVALGFRPEEFDGFGVPLRERTAIFEEEVEVLRALWTGFPTTLAGSHFSVSEVSLPAGRSSSHPAPPIWIAAEARPAIRRAARIGDAWLPSDTAPIHQLEESLADYRAELAEHGRDFSSVARPLMREVAVAADPDSARSLLAAHVIERYRTYWQGGSPQLRAEFPSGDFTFKDLDRGRFIVGSPGECVDQILAHRDRLELTWMILRVQRKGIDHQAVIDQIRLLGDQVLPKCRN